MCWTKERFQRRLHCQRGLQDCELNQSPWLYCPVEVPIILVRNLVIRWCNEAHPNKFLLSEYLWWSPQKLEKLIRDETRSAEGERSDTALLRGLLLTFIIGPISDSLKYLSRDNLLFDKSKEASIYICTEIPKVVTSATSFIVGKSDKWECYLFLDVILVDSNMNWSLICIWSKVIFCFFRTRQNQLLRVSLLSALKHPCGLDLTWAQILLNFFLMEMHIC